MNKTKFDDIITMDVKLTLGQLINLFLRGYDDKIYIDVTIIKYVDGIRCEDNLEDVRIISEWLEPYYDYKIEALSDSNNGLLSVTIKEENNNE